jgi:hydrogenase nickel incorporation protein HypA/HybF
VHEAGIAEAVIDQVRELAKANALVRVTAVALAIGVKRLVEPESLRLAFELASEGTVAAGARLEIAEVPLAARCRACGESYAPTPRDFRCPACQRAEPDILAGDDIVITSVSGDDGKD